MLIIIGWSSVGIVYAQPDMPEDTIPKGIAKILRAHMRDLYDEDPVKRAEAALAIGDMGERAYYAIPFLIGMLHEWDIRREMWRAANPETSPGKAAAVAIQKIGSPAIPALINVVRAPLVCGQVSALSA